MCSHRITLIIGKENNIETTVECSSLSTGVIFNILIHSLHTFLKETILLSETKS